MKAILLYEIQCISFVINVQIEMVAIFDFIKIAQVWQLHTLLDIIMGVSNMNM